MLHATKCFNRVCRDGWHKITPTGYERHTDKAFFLSSQPLPHSSLHLQQIFFYGGLRGKKGGRLSADPHRVHTSSPLYPALDPNFTLSFATCTHANMHTQAAQSIHSACSRFLFTTAFVTQQTTALLLFVCLTCLNFRM